MKICSYYHCKNEAKNKYCSEECRVFGTYKTVSSFKKYVWKLYSKYIKLRDSDKYGYGTCITCGKRDLASASDMHAGHWLHGDNPGTWINDKNVHLQCGFKCNINNGGQRDIYALELERRYGFGILQELDKAYHHPPTTWSMTPLREAYKELKKKLDTLRDN
jgi:hypothetical protein